MEERLVTDMHPQRDLRLFAVTSKMTLADQDSRDEPALQIRQGWGRLSLHGGIVSPSSKT
jgi:hypothetical protein